MPTHEETGQLNCPGCARLLGAHERCPWATDRPPTEDAPPPSHAALIEEVGRLRRALAALTAPARDLLALIHDPGPDDALRLLVLVSERRTHAALDLLRAALPAAEEVLR